MHGKCVTKDGRMKRERYDTTLVGHLRYCNILCIYVYLFDILKIRSERCIGRWKKLIKGMMRLAAMRKEFEPIEDMSKGGVS